MENLSELLTLIQTGEDKNIELAFELAKGLKIDLDRHIRKHYNLDWFLDTEICQKTASTIINIKQIINLKKLDLRNTSIIELPPQIGNLTNLKILNLRNTSIIELPPQIGNLTNLKTLNLRNTSIIELPPQIGNLTNLQTLYLSDITKLPPEIENLTNLQTLYLLNIDITKLPLEIKNITSLKTLYLSDINITELPPKIKNITNSVILQPFHESFDRSGGTSLSSSFNNKITTWENLFIK